MTFDPITQQNIDLWLTGNYEAGIKLKIMNLLERDPKQLIDAFYTNLQFGTGGLRGIMGVGPNRMNNYTVGAAAQGLANYLLHSSDSKHAVIIGYDSRHLSREFAEITATVLAANGIRAFLYRDMHPSPLVSFGCRYKHCSAGIMITASHNPPEYNGFKVFWNDGAQILPPHDKNIMEEIQKITDPSLIKLAESIKDPLIKMVGSEIDNAYLKAIYPLQLNPDMNKKQGSQLKIVYSNLHGTGIVIIPKALRTSGFTQIYFVEQQMNADGNFPNAPLPNPEEAEALQLGIKKLKELKADLLIATDPDADRIGIAVPHQGEIHLINGNQMACICLEYILQTLSSQNKLAERAAFVKTICTTELFKVICEAYHRQCADVLTGFKYIAEKIKEWEMIPQGPQFIFGGEESYGYLLGTQTRDKDAIVAALLIAEVALSAKMKAQTLIDFLHEIYKKYGFYLERLETLQFPETKEGREKMAETMKRLRNTPPKSLAGIAVEWFEDLLVATKKNLKTGQTEPSSYPVANVLIYRLEDGSQLVMRPSGTEPKIKIYCGVKQQAFTSLKEAETECLKKIGVLIEACAHKERTNQKQDIGRI